MANKYRGFVEFADSDGQKYVLRFGTNEFVANQAELLKLDGREYQRFFLHKALVYGGKADGYEAQESMTLEDAGDLLDDIGYIRANELIEQTKFGINGKAAMERDRKAREEAALAAARTIGLKIKALKQGVTDPAVITALDDVAAKIDGMVKEGSANPQ